MATEGKNLSEYNKDYMPDASNMRFGLVVSEWNHEITEGMAQGAIKAFLDNGAKEENIVRLNVPGSFELINGSRKFCKSKEYDAVVAIGSVIQGETRHFDFVCQGTANGIAKLNAKYTTPVIFCVLTDNNMQQAIDRSGGKHGNKGVEAAIAAIRMAYVKHRKL